MTLSKAERLLLEECKAFLLHFKGNKRLQLGNGRAFKHYEALAKLFTEMYGPDWMKND